MVDRVFGDSGAARGTRDVESLQGERFLSGASAVCITETCGAEDLAPSGRWDLAIRYPKACTTVWSTAFDPRGVSDAEHQSEAAGWCEQKDATIGGVADRMRAKLGV
jgi:hypothetical protein